jgi:hypothetical protein
VEKFATISIVIAQLSAAQIPEGTTVYFGRTGQNQSSQAADCDHDFYEALVTETLKNKVSLRVVPRETDAAYSITCTTADDIAALTTQMFGHQRLTFWEENNSSVGRIQCRERQNAQVSGSFWYWRAPALLALGNCEAVKASRVNHFAMAANPVAWEQSGNNKRSLLLLHALKSSLCHHLSPCDSVLQNTFTVSVLVETQGRGH